MESSSTVGVVRDARMSVLSSSDLLLNRIGRPGNCAGLRSGRRRRRSIASARNKRIKKGRVRRLADRIVRASRSRPSVIRATFEQRLVRGEELQLLLILIGREKIGRVRVFARLRPEHDAVHAVSLRKNDRAVANLEEIRRSRGRRSRRRASSPSSRSVQSRSSAAACDPRAGVVAPANDVFAARSSSKPPLRVEIAARRSRRSCRRRSPSRSSLNFALPAPSATQATSVRGRILAEARERRA